MLTYIVALVLAVGFARWAEKRRAQGDRSAILAVTVVAVAFAAIAGLRWRVGTDYWNYERFYYIFVSDRIETWRDVAREPGLVAFARVGAFVWDDPQVMFLLASIFTIALFVWAYWRDASSFSLAVLFFVTVGVWHGSFNAVRQYMAMAVLLVAYRYVVERRPYRYAALVGLASLFHISAIAGILIYAIPRRRLSVLEIFGLTLASVVALASTSVVVEALSGFIGAGDIASNEYVQRSVNPLRVAVMLVPVVLYLVLRVEEPRGPEEAHTLNMLFVNGSMWIAAAGSAYLARFSVYTLAYLPLALPVLIDLISPRDRRLVRASLVLMFTIFWLVEIVSDPAITTYESVFDRD